MFSFSTLIVFLVALALLYVFIRMYKKIQRKEVGEKLEEVNEIDQLVNSIKEVDVKTTTKKKQKIKQFTKL